MSAVAFKHAWPKNIACTLFEEVCSASTSLQHPHNPLQALSSMLDIRNSLQKEGFLIFFMHPFPANYYVFYRIPFLLWCPSTSHRGYREMTTHFRPWMETNLASVVVVI